LPEVTGPVLFQTFQNGVEIPLRDERDDFRSALFHLRAGVCDRGSQGRPNRFRDPAFFSLQSVLCTIEMEGPECVPDSDQVIA
jgi:hypothetical protein